MLSAKWQQIHLSFKVVTTLVQQFVDADSQFW